MNIIEKRATNPASALTGAELVYVGQAGDDAVTTMQDIANLTNVQSIIVAASDETTALTTGTAKVTFRMPYAFTLTSVRAKGLKITLIGTRT